MEIRADQGGSTHHIPTAHTVRNLKLPYQTLSEHEIKRYAHIRRLGIKTLRDERPMVLLGQDNWDMIVSREIREGDQNDPVASRTKLGWIVHGPMPLRDPKSTTSMVLCTSDGGISTDTCPESPDEKEVSRLVKEYFQLDSIGIVRNDRKNVEEERVNELLRERTQRDGERWETCLLWKRDSTKLPDNRETALKRFQSLQKRMARDPEYCATYHREIRHFIDSGYAERIQSTSSHGNPVWYLPHFGVSHPNKPKKLRLVFDAASKTNGVSLNSELHSGPDLLTSLVGVLMRFRQRKVAFVGDIREMFLQIKMRPEDRHAQRFLWCDNGEQTEPEEFCMTSMIFGATSSPCSAMYVKNRNALEFEKEFPQAVNAILNKHYMDDYLDATNTEEEAIELIKQVTEIHRRGGFEIRGWVSNSQRVWENVPNAKTLPNGVALALEDNNIERTLGLKWNPAKDTLMFDIGLKKIPEEILRGERRPTKRQMLRVTMSIFDPHGFLAPYTVRSKILLQNVWRSGVGWDQLLANDDFNQWRNWLDDLKLLENLSIPRCYLDRPEISEKVELHTFCDASEQAYAAVSYWRFEYTDGHVHVAFAASRNRVAPLKPQSIPRMELQAAVIASRLAHTVEKEHEFKAHRRVFWTDSRTVWLWLRSDPRTYQAFVSHRLGEIEESTKKAEWRWLPSKENPADDATRETRYIVREHSRWIQGPSFLKYPESQWPVETRDDAKGNEAEETKEKRTRFAGIMTAQERLPLPEATRFSSWKRLIRSTAWVLLFLDKCRGIGSASLTKDHTDKAEQLWIRQTQRDAFRSELRELESQKPISTHSRLQKLTPMLGIDGVIRLQGRVGQVEGVNEEAKSPVILDGKQTYTKLLVDHYHRLANHGSTEMVVNELRRRYWILNLRPTVRTTANRCQLCKVRKAKPQPPMMGDLPTARTAHHQRPFTYCGVDYFGPMQVTIGRRREKRWGVLFTCMTTRAIHLEIAASLTADSTIMALRRMASRRGYPSEMFSDNGTNLRGANNELRKAVEEIDTTRQQVFATSRDLRWRFIPPTTPHMGGCWERLVRSVKIALDATLKERSPHEETLATLMAEAEHVVNSRPLTHVSVDADDQEALTPNHFLIGTSAGFSMPGEFTDDDLCLRKKWRIAQRLADRFWNRWLTEYLPTLLPRDKWNRRTRKLEVGDLVVIMDETLPRNTWPRGIIVQTYPGKDGHVRVVDVKTRGGIMKRPAIKVIQLPTAEVGAENAVPAPGGSMSPTE